jgi:Uma2 family endonuclease
MQVRLKSVSIDEWAAAYGETSAEVINGEIIIMSPHGRRHSWLVKNLQLPLMKFVYDRNLGDVLAEASFVLEGDPRERWVSGSRVPDLAFIQRERIETHNAEHPDMDDPWWLSPDLVIEVISPTDTYTDLSQKVADYLKAGVRLVWMIDPKQRSIRVHSPEQPTGRTLIERDSLTDSPVLEGWSLPVSEVFKGT